MVYSGYPHTYSMGGVGRSVVPGTLVATQHRWRRLLTGALTLAAAPRRWPSAHQALVDRLAASEQAVRETLGAWQATEAARVQAFVRTHGTLPPPDPGRIRQLERLLDPPLIEVFLNEYQRLTEGTPLEQIGVRMVRQVRQAVQTHAQTTQRWLTERVGPRLTDGTPQADILTAIADVYRQTQAVRVPLLAATEAMRMAQAAQVAAARAEGEPVLTWQATMDGKTCGWCADLHGTLVALDRPLYVLGDTITNTRGQAMEVHYSDIEHPPLHPLCRCVLV